MTGVGQPQLVPQGQASHPPAWPGRALGCLGRLSNHNPQPRINCGPARDVKKQPEKTIRKRL